MVGRACYAVYSPTVYMTPPVCTSNAEWLEVESRFPEYRVCTKRLSWLHIVSHPLYRCAALPNAYPDQIMILLITGQGNVSYRRCRYLPSKPHGVCTLRAIGYNGLYVRALSSSSAARGVQSFSRISRSAKPLLIFSPMSLTYTVVVDDVLVTQRCSYSKPQTSPCCLCSVRCYRCSVHF